MRYRKKDGSLMFLPQSSEILSVAVGSPTYDLSDAGFCSFSIERDNILFRGASDMSKESMDWIEEQLKEEEDGGSKIQQQAETVSI